MKFPNPSWLCCVFLLIFAAGSLGATVDRSKPNIYRPGPWTLPGNSVQNVVYQGRQALKVPKGSHVNGVIFRSPRFSVVAGRTYTCSIMFRGDVWPSTSMRFGVSFYNRSNYLGNSGEASTWTYHKSDQGKWREAFHIFKAKGNQALLLMSRFEDSSINEPVYLRKDVHCHEGVHMSGKPPAKKPFLGSYVKVTPDGLFIVDGKPIFLRCAFPDNNNPNWETRWSQLAKAGFNCNMWIVSKRQLERSVKAGFKYNFMGIAGWFHKKSKPPQQGWGYGNWPLLRRNLKEILRSPYKKNLVGYYFDDEAISQYDFITKAAGIVDEFDKGARPKYFLEGNPGTALHQMGNMDITGTYSGGNTGGEGSGSTAAFILRWAEGMTAPVVFVQINRGGNPASKTVKQTFQAGSSALGYWRFFRTDKLGQGRLAFIKTFPQTVKRLQSVLNPRFERFTGEVEELKEPEVDETKCEEAVKEVIVEVPVCDSECQQNKIIVERLKDLQRELRKAQP